MVKAAIKKLLLRSGWQLQRISTRRNIAGASDRPVGNMKHFLEDVAARGFTPRGMIDIGANRGQWTRLALSVFSGCPIIAIEPQAELEDGLRGLCKDCPGFEYVLAGAGSSEGWLPQAICSDSEASTFLTQKSENLLASGRQRMTRVVTVDSLLADKPSFSPDLVKLDVQGFELQALLGAKRLFGKTELFILETHLYEFDEGMPLARECIIFMAERGYELYEPVGFHRRPLDGALGSVDLAFAKVGGILRRAQRWR